jgi:two-component system CheB/CheR fusion protein
LVNRAWREFAERNGNPDLHGSGAGTNYLAVCRCGAAVDASVLPVLRGLSEVLTGERESFASEYACDMPDGRHWFRMQVSALADGAVIVTHVDLRRRDDATSLDATAVGST